MCYNDHVLYTDEDTDIRGGNNFSKCKNQSRDRDKK